MSIVKQKAWLPFENEPTSTLTCELLQPFIKSIDLSPTPVRVDLLTQMNLEFRRAVDDIRQTLILEQVSFGWSLSSLVKELLRYFLIAWDNSLSTNSWNAGSNHFSILMFFQISFILPRSKMVLIHRNHPAAPRTRRILKVTLAG